MADPKAAEAVVRRFVEAFGSGDLEGLRSLLADDFVGHVTTACGGTREVSASEYIESVAQMDVGTASLRLDLPDVTRIDDDTVLAMVEVHASRHGRTLHNFSAQLARMAGDRLAELWMVEAEPAESDAFWST